MRFLRWYGRLTERAFSSRDEVSRSFINNEATRIWDSFKWSVVTQLLGLFIVLLWFSTPEYFREGIIGRVSMV